MANAWQKMKTDIKESNAKVMADHRERTGKISKPKEGKRPTGNKFLLILGGTILSLPLLAVGIVLFIMAALLFWDAFIGL
ncbi:hypothetical protein FQ085_06590 [Planococcus sp. ANT_H30]|uniref:hypothetical protein n=1 Tax=Planococcus sp. ANT_H30 TaxID=2597347 RepID=UPI0011EE1650|nr:hypothetical protein [Planococcus sp. ANT_H30]KAA0957714.1 hypothetical protein FQ085_06590 [Planococcus sp. ANT_H30]